MRALQALPTLLRIGFAQAIAYRAETVVWVVTSSLPLIMLPLWHAVAEEAPVRGFGQTRFTAYFLAAFVVRQLVGAWAAWTINYEVRQGTLSQRLLKPIHPIWSYGASSLASLPVRFAISLPIALGAFLFTAGSHIADSTAEWLALPLALIGAWSITFLAHVSVGALSFWMHQSIRVMDVYSAGFFVFSGYLIPLALFPEGLQGIPQYLPFPYQLGFVVDLLTGALEPPEVWPALARQWMWVAALALVATALWRRGLRRYGAFGG